MSRRIPFNLKRLSHLISPLLGLILFGVSLWVISQELRQYHIQDVLHSLAAIPDSYLLLAVGLTLLNYIVLTGYDTLAGRYVRHSLAYRKSALTAIITYAVSNSVGFALLSGSAIRYRLYLAWGLSTVEIAQIIAFCNLSFWLGLFAMGSIMFLWEPIAIPTLLHLPFASARPIGAMFLIVIIGYLLWNILGPNSLKVGRWMFPQLSVKLALAQIVVASCDWALAAAILYALLPSTASLTYGSFFATYLLAQIAGIISSVPGGLGVFETVMLLLISPPIPSPALFGALLAYRGIYYFLPLGLAVLLLGFYELRQWLPFRLPPR